MTNSPYLGALEPGLHALVGSSVSGKTSCLLNEMCYQAINGVRTLYHTQDETYANVSQKVLRILETYHTKGTTKGIHIVSQSLSASNHDSYFFGSFIKRLPNLVRLYQLDMILLDLDIANPEILGTLNKLAADCQIPIFIAMHKVASPVVKAFFRTFKGVYRQACFLSIDNSETTSETIITISDKDWRDWRLSENLRMVDLTPVAQESLERSREL